MKNILVVGAFGYENNQLDGQTIKTRNVYDLLQRKHKGKLSYIDTLSLRRKPQLGFEMLYKLITCNTLIILPCLNNLTVMFPVFYYMSKIFRFDIISICIGGWQVEYFLGSEKFRCHPLQMEMSKKIKAFLPEMIRVNKDLINQCGFTNTEVFPNFRNFHRSTQVITNESGLRLVFMARVNKMKGYDVIFDSLHFIRENCPGSKVDFYGGIASEDKDDFMNKVKANCDIASYKGVLTPEKIHDTLNNYDVLLLPTKYYTEGFPGSILDAYISGIPVIVTEWKHAHEFVSDKNTGIIIPFNNNQEAFNNSILSLFMDRNKLNYMKSAAYKEADKYSDEAAWAVLKKYL